MTSIAARLQFTAEDNAGDDNVSAKAADTTVQAAKVSVRKAYRKHRRKPYSLSKHSRSHLQQKQAIKREYVNAKRNGNSAAQTSAKAAERAAKRVKRTGRFVVRHKKGFMIAGVIAAIIAICLSMFSSCSVMLQGGISGIAATTYPSADSEMLAAEAQYCAMEAELQSYLDSYESTHNYDEYHFNLDDIEHDPYVLISIVTAYIGGEWTMADAQSVLEMLFERQYTLTENVTTETRTRRVTNDEGEEESENYTYSICTVTLENFDLSHLPVYIMSQEQVSMYSAYMGTLGNRPDLFPGSSYVNRYGANYDVYKIPPEALKDKQFAAMIKEAEKYLGFPYVWGGASPETSFDCSGFVSWVINHCGVGWDFGRRGTDSLYFDICTPIPPSEAKPGDLIFFEKTYDTTGTSHVGIYVGDGRMLHCGDPIRYVNIETSYWQEHFYGFGRLPSP